MMNGMLSRAVLALSLLVVPTIGSAYAPSCAELAEAAGAENGVPQGLLSAISLVETRRKGRSWPWTLNEGGKSMYFATRGEALDYLTDAVARGVRNIDVGCMQLNFRWHAAGFTSLDAMLDPQQNTRYAALFMVELHKRLGSWEEATKHYHSADDDRGSAYRDKVVAASLEGGATGDAAAQTSEPTLRMAADDNSASPVRGPLVALTSTGPTLDDLVMASAEAAGKAMNFAAAAPESLPLRGRSELPPRLSRRWNELQEVRALLAQGS